MLEDRWPLSSRVYHAQCAIALTRARRTALRGTPLTARDGRNDAPDPLRR